MRHCAKYLYKAFKSLFMRKLKLLNLKPKIRVYHFCACMLIKSNYDTFVHQYKCYILIPIDKDISFVHLTATESSLTVINAN